MSIGFSANIVYFRKLSGETRRMNRRVSIVSSVRTFQVIRQHSIAQCTVILISNLYRAGVYSFCNCELNVNSSAQRTKQIRGALCALCAGLCDVKCHLLGRTRLLHQLSKTMHNHLITSIDSVLRVQGIKRWRHTPNQVNSQMISC